MWIARASSGTPTGNAINHDGFYKRVPHNSGGFMKYCQYMCAIVVTHGVCVCVCVCVCVWQVGLCKFADGS